MLLILYRHGDKIMDSQITADDRKRIEAGIREKNIAVAKSPEGYFNYPTGKKALRASIMIKL
jgi:hypothetical protein